MPSNFPTSAGSGADEDHQANPAALARVLCRADGGGHRTHRHGLCAAAHLPDGRLAAGGPDLAGKRVRDPASGETALFITPGHAFRVVDGLVTNFHVPRSSLLMLVSAFAGVEAIRHAYREAIAARYRFYSYGDAMLIV